MGRQARTGSRGGGSWKNWRVGGIRWLPIDQRQARTGGARGCARQRVKGEAKAGCGVARGAGAGQQRGGVRAAARRPSLLLAALAAAFVALLAPAKGLADLQAQRDRFKKACRVGPRSAAADLGQGCFGPGTLCTLAAAAAARPPARPAGLACFRPRGSFSSSGSGSPKSTKGSWRPKNMGDTTSLGNTGQQRMAESAAPDGAPQSHREAAANEATQRNKVGRRLCGATGVAGRCCGRCRTLLRSAGAAAC